MKNKNKQTKFPVARIKKIMQKDEEVGKVAQATPIVISKALELFLGLIIEETHKITTERGSKKVEAYHLKHAVENTEMLDFLKEIVESVPDPSAGGTIDLDTEHPESGKKKRGKGKKVGVTGEPGMRKRRKKKGEVEAEGESGEVIEGEMKSEPEPEQEGDSMMYEEDEDRRQEKHRRSGYGQKSRSSEDGDWRDDKPFMPSR